MTIDSASAANLPEGQIFAILTSGENNICKIYQNRLFGH
jgi:hypothetical protein